MLSSVVVQIVDFCVRRRWQVVIFGILLAIACWTYSIRHFSITTDTDSLISARLPWHQRQLVLAKAFPQKGILVVVTAATPENAEQAANALEHQLSKTRICSTRSFRPAVESFFQHNGLLFKSLSDV